MIFFEEIIKGHGRVEKRVNHRVLLINWVYLAQECKGGQLFEQNAKV